MALEEVLVVRSDKVADLLAGKGHGMCFPREDQVMQFVLENHTFMERNEAEFAPEYKQIIPYLLITNRSNYILTQRTWRQTEKRLHNKLSIGFGGHINPAEKTNSENVIMQGLYKELSEEVSLSQVDEIRFCGVVNDDTSEVGRYHLGLVFLVIAGNDEFEIVERHKMTGRWASKSEIKAIYDDMESWSQIVFRDLISSNYVKSKRLDNV